MVTALIFMLILTTAVTIHELAHYFNAKSVGLEVDSFSVGMGPVLLRKKWRGTEWRLSALPLGGYVMIPGMTGEQGEDGEFRHATTGFATKPLWAKLWVLVGGVVANFILAILLLATVLSAEPMMRLQISDLDVQMTAAAQTVQPGSEAERLGLEAGDLITRVNGIENPDTQELIDEVQTAQGLELTILRGDETLQFSTDWPPENVEVPLLGIGIGDAPLEPVPSINFFQAINEASSFLINIIPETIEGFGRGIGDAVAGQQSENVAGPVQIVNITNQARQAGIIPVLFIAAMINFSLAVFNLLPIPGLDGGRMVLSTLIAIRGKPFKPGQEEFINFLGVAAVIMIMVLITFNEVRGLLFPG